MANNHNTFMNRCIKLAKNGTGLTYPNPFVGAVIIENDKIISEGWHMKAGEMHAEVAAIKGLKKKHSKNLTLYVNLEPCSHHGRTPPCCDLIIKSGIKKVVIGCEDPNPKVSGRGIKKLINGGVEVISGILEDECIELNKRFFTVHKKNRPYIILKWAESLDGFISPHTKNKNKPYWISDIYSRQLTHMWRTQENSIMVGYNTVESDNPKLTSRHIYGKNPIRIIIDVKNTLNREKNVFNKDATTIIFNSLINKKEKNIEFIKINEKNNLDEILRKLYEKDIQSIIIEGGKKTIEEFINNKNWDECRIFKSKKKLKKGIKSPTIHSDKKIQKLIVSDYLEIFKNNNA